MHTGLDVSNVTRIARDAVRQHSLPVEVVGVVLGGADTDYVEVLVTVHGCASEPCQFAIGVFRSSSENALLRDIAAALRRHVDEHRGTR